MAESSPDQTTHKITRVLNLATNLPKALIILAIISIVSGISTGFVLSRKSSSLIGGDTTSSKVSGIAIPAQQAQTLCRDFAEGTLRTRPKASDTSEYTEGTHLLDRGPGQYPVALTSSSVDLSKFEEKKVKVFGETQKALKEGWLMDVCKVEEK